MAPLMTDAKSLACQLFRDDMARVDEVPVEHDGSKAYAGWLRASEDAGDRDTRDALLGIDAGDFVSEWNDLAAAALIVPSAKLEGEVV